MATKIEHIHSITGIRAVLMLLVLFFHVYAFIAKSAFTLPAILAQPLSHFWVAVDMFFVLSGYVIALNYYHSLKNKQLSYRNYLVSRIARIFPAHIFLMLAFLIFILSFYGLEFFRGGEWEKQFPFNNKYLSWSFIDFLKTLFLVQSWGIPTQMGWSFVAWSVSCELFVYLLFPIFIRVSNLFSSSKKLLIISAVIIYLIGLIALLFSTQKYGINPTGVVRVTFGFYIGIVVYLLTQEHQSNHIQTTYSLLAYIASLLICLLFLFSAYYFLSFIWLIPAFAVLLYLLASRKLAAPVLSSRLFVYLGKISYSFYLVHGILLIVWRILFPLNTVINKGKIYVLLYILSYVIACFIVSALTFHCVEEPSRKKIRQYFS